MYFQRSALVRQFVIVAVVTAQAFFYTFITATTAHAKVTHTIIVVPTKFGGAYQEFIRAFQDSYAASGGNTAAVIVVESAFIDASLFDNKNARLIVSVGTVATQRVFEINKSVPVLSTLVPRNSYRILEQNARQQGRLYSRSAIHLDQPISRHMGLVHRILPNKKTVSVVLGPNTRFLTKELKLAAENEGMHIHIETMGYLQRLIGPLNRALEGSDAFIAVPDSVVSNRRTVQNLLLTTYRQRVPVIAYSRAYVRAGALAAVYSTPEQIGRQAGELVGELVRSNSWSLPALLYPKYFSVDVNRDVARSLGINVPPKKDIERSLLAANGEES